jgi:5-methylcytosine-specific restriction protein A
MYFSYIFNYLFPISIPANPFDKIYGRSPQWDKLAKTIVKEVGRCEICKSKATLEVHHKKPYHLYPELELDRDNLCVLCRRDHFIFGHLGDWTAWNKDIDMDIKTWTKKFVERLYERI